MINNNYTWGSVLRMGIYPALIWGLFVSGLAAQGDTTSLGIGQWRSLLPYRSGPYVAQSAGKIFYATELSLLTLDKTDLSSSFLTRELGLSHTGIRLIRYNPLVKALIVVYNNSVIDVIPDEGKIVTLNQVQNFKNFIGDKELFDVYSAPDSTVYLAGNYGLSRLNLKKGEFIFTTFTGLDVRSAVVFEGYLYAATEAGIYRIAENASNPENFGNWEFLGAAQGFPASYSTTAMVLYKGQLYLDINQAIYRLEGGKPVFFFQKTGYALKFLSAEGPHLLAGYRCASSGCANGTVLYFTPAGLGGEVDGSCCGQPNYALEDSQGRVWFGDNFRGFRYLNTIGNSRCNLLTFDSPYSSSNRELVVSQKQLWVAAGGVNQTFSYLFLDHGFSSYIDGQWTIYNRGTRQELKGENPNDPDDDLFDIMTIAVHPGNGKVYAGSFFEGLLELEDGKMRLFNEKNSTLNNAVGDSQRTRISGLAFDKDNRLWVSNHLADRPISVLLPDGAWKSFKPSCSETQIHQIGIDGNGFKWFVSNASNTGLLVFDEGKLDDPNDDRCRLITQNNSNLPTNIVNCLAVDLEGDVWVGTSEGIVIFECGNSVFEPERCQGTLRVVEQEDGFLDYLLITEEVRTIAVDGGNRKWVGTQNGIFVLSPSGKQLVARFTTANAPLLDNRINDIAIDQEAGLVYIGTESGITSYQGDAIAGDQIHLAKADVYPNPVAPDYEGPVAIRGLSRDAEVKITDIRGRLVFETKALGGQAIWNARDYQGNRVRSGVYLVWSSTSSREAGFAEPTTAVARILVQN
ncbi:MAG: hypothetical protein KIPDCIKN_00758 [Haliscomenobacter sp.]|jgi:sugar lactone lactonase YvrE|nr:hypothetical protein [Haliscomenobacter sp.]